MTQTSIEWTNKTWNPTTGCDRISPGCAHCYAKEIHDRRHKAHLLGKTMFPQYHVPFETLLTHGNRLDQPLRWKKPQRIFVNSMSDLFHEDIPDDFIKSVFTVMAIAKRHTFQVLTKRAERMRDIVSSWRADDMYDFWYSFDGGAREIEAWPLPNVWLGVSVENQHFADERIPLLLQTPAAVRFISAEPLLGPIAIRNYLISGPDPAHCANCGRSHGFTRCPNYGSIAPRDGRQPRCDTFKRQNFDLDWVIVGGESGLKARPCALEWIESVVTQCRAANVPVFVKQIGAYVVSEQRTCKLELLDALKPKVANRFPKAPNGEYWAWRAGTVNKKGGDPSEWPEDLRVREFPIGRRA